jgi:hypothetical protein
MGYRRADTLSGHLPETNTTFMRTCRQVYHEAADYLYSRGRIGIEIDGDSLRMLGLSFKPAINASPCPGAFTYIRRLDFRIMLNLRQGLNLHEVCLTHMTIAYLANFVKKHQLQDVSILLEMHLPHDHLSFQKTDMAAQLLQHKAGDLTWPHIATFVIDPLRDIQVRRSGKVIFDRPLHTPQVFQIPAFRHLPADLAETMRSGRHGGDKHSKFVPYLEALQAVCDSLQTFYYHDSDDVNTVAYCDMLLHSEEMLYDIRCAVIRGDIEALLVYHNEYIRRLLLMLPDPGVCEPGKTNFDLGLSMRHLSNDQAVALSSTLAVLSAAFPRDVEIFSLGAMHVEGAITEWNSRKDLEGGVMEYGNFGPGKNKDPNTGARDEVYFFNGLWCGGNHDRGPLTTATWDLH